MSAFKELTNQVFGKLTALRCVGRNKWGNAIWLCRCSCDGREIEVSGGELTSGGTASCGCSSREFIATLMAGRCGENHPTFKHGHKGYTESSTYRSWRAMRRRCESPRDIGWKHYGGATPPVLVCDRWMGEQGFENFLSDMGERPEQPEKTSLGRFGDVGSYDKSNCAWQTAKEQGATRHLKHQLQLQAA